MSDDDFDIDNMDYGLPLESSSQPHQELDKTQILEATKLWWKVYPIYINEKRPTSKGRLIAIKDCVPDPSVLHMAHALESFKHDFVLEPMKRHPCDALVFGRLRVKPIGRKQDILRKIGSKMKDLEWILEIERINPGLKEQAKATRSEIS